MPLHTYSFQNKKRDLADTLSTVIRDEPRFISCFRQVEIATARKHEWLEDQIGGRALSAVSVSGSTISAAAKDLAKLRVGTLFTVRNDSALFRVASVGASSFTVELAAANGSELTVPATGDELRIVSTPMPEATDNGSGEENYQFGEVEFNCTQIFRKEIVFSGSAMAVDLYGGLDGSLDRQTAFALGELARDLNRAAIFGRRVEATPGVAGETGGLYYFGTRSGVPSINAEGNRIDSFIANDAAAAVSAEGGDPVLLLCSPGQARVLSNEFRNQLQVLRADDARGAYVARIVNESTGRAMTIMADPDLPGTDAWLVDPAGFGISNLRGRAIADEDATPAGFDGVRRMALGELTFVFRNAKQRLCRIHGLQSATEALADIRG